MNTAIDSLVPISPGLGRSGEVFKERKVPNQHSNSLGRSQGVLGGLNPASLQMSRNTPRITQEHFQQALNAAFNRSGGKSHTTSMQLQDIPEQDWTNAADEFVRKHSKKPPQWPNNNPKDIKGSGVPQSEGAWNHLDKKQSVHANDPIDQKALDNLRTELNEFLKMLLTCSQLSGSYISIR